MKIHIHYSWKGEDCDAIVVQDVRGYEGFCFNVKNNYGDLIASNIPFEEVSNIYYYLIDGWDGVNNVNPYIAKGVNQGEEYD